MDLSMKIPQLTKDSSVEIDTKKLPKLKMSGSVSCCNYSSSNREMDCKELRKSYKIDKVKLTYVSV